MKKELQLQPNEPLHDWIDRLADNLVLSVKQREAMHEVSKKSYIKGIHEALKANETAQARYTIEYADNGVIIRDPILPYTEVVAFVRNDNPTPCAIALGKLIYEDIEEAENNFEDDFIGYELTINIEPLKPQDNG
jgi:hypothetical protein